MHLISVDQLCVLESGPSARCLSMAQPSEPPDAAPTALTPGVLPANVDDPRFTSAPSSDRHAEWTTGSTLTAELMEPLDEARTIATSPAGLAALVEAGLQLVLEVLGSLLSTGLSHWGR